MALLAAVFIAGLESVGGRWAVVGIIAAARAVHVAVILARAVLALLATVSIAGLEGVVGRWAVVSIIATAGPPLSTLVRARALVVGHSTVSLTRAKVEWWWSTGCVIVIAAISQAHAVGDAPAVSGESTANAFTRTRRDKRFLARRAVSSIICAAVLFKAVGEGEEHAHRKTHPNKRIHKAFGDIINKLLKQGGRGKKGEKKKR